MSNANDCPVRNAGRAVEPTEPEDTVRAEIARLEGELAERPTDVELLTALMRAYRTVGNEERLWGVMRTLRDLRMGRCADMKRELGAFRELASLELKLEEWPQAIPLMERALRLYDMTHQPIKREAIRKRLEAVDPTNPNVPRYFEVEERLARKAAAEKIRKMSDDQRQTLEQARALVKEAGRCSTSMLQRQMGISYNQAVKLVEILRAEQNHQPALQAKLKTAILPINNNAM